MSAEATLTVPRYKDGSPLTIRRLIGAPRGGGGWSGRLELEVPGVGDALTAWMEAEYYAGRGIPSVTICGLDDQGEFRYVRAALRFQGGDAFSSMLQRDNEYERPILSFLSAKCAPCDALVCDESSRIWVARHVRHDSMIKAA